MAEPMPDQGPQSPQLKPYVKPTLIDYGTVRASTGTLSMKGDRDGGPSNSKS
jgi:hypothetical protein